ncbi:branched-chain amino acid ABC transporter permease [Paralimibaculum aggregatum]|uniref:Branched-chain amino acid ABC transporter permease n=1 Tax=Paralimibaculum aggregatum TaxID=3036245 RepID=A0ABQ6LRQ3_9RHOB|nr:branched-chain amino acid ABC transporter permease [Limibaculum sp. NKW23]GMG84006.1 branched-chain amino acid ABC transporter permease [Limibaculum sp. NKW23]
MNLQLFVNGLVNASLIAPPAIAFTLLFGVLRFPNFAIGGYITVGAFMAYTANVIFAWPLVAATLFAMAVTALVVWLSDVVVFAPLRNQEPVTLLVVSIAFSLILENLVRLFFASDVRGFDIPLERPIKVMGARITPEQLDILMLAFAITVAVHVVLRFTRFGKAMRAVADNPVLAQVRGLSLRWITAGTCALAGAIFGLTGVFAGLDLVIEPLIGWNLTIPIFAAAILGGIGSPMGALVGAICVGMAEELTILVLPSTYKIAVGFLIIAVFLLLRPQGLFGQPEIKK